MAKATELRELPDEELLSRLEASKEELFNLRFQFATSQLDNPIRMSEVRHDVARILTILRERQTEEQLERAVARIGHERVLFGTDESPPDPRAYAIHFRFLETLDEHFAYASENPPPQGRWAISGLGLDDESLQAVYSQNALRLFPRLTI